MNSFRPISALFCLFLASCQTGAGSGGPPRSGGVMGVDEFQRSRHLLNGRTVRIEGFLMAANRTFFLVDGRPRDDIRTAEDRRYRSWCLVPHTERPLWLVARNGSLRWGPVRLDVAVGVHVVIEGQVMWDRVYPDVTEDALELGPLRRPRIVRVLGDRCAGSSPDFGLR